jgi:hypothetical protein
MAFSQELKVAVFRRGFRCGELPITYSPRAGQTKMRPIRDGVGNVGQLLGSRLRPIEPVGPRMVDLTRKLVGTVERPPRWDTTITMDLSEPVGRSAPQPARESVG